MKEKIKTTSFWLGLSGVVVIIIESISSLFEFDVASEVVEGIVLSISSILVLIGVITKKNSNDSHEYSKEDLLMELKEIENCDDENNIDI